MANEDPTVRVQCTIPTASHEIAGVRFGRAPKQQDGEAARMVSAPITVAEADRFCAIEGFARYDETDAAVLDAIDQAMADAETAARGSASGATATAQELHEHQRANQALTIELAAARRRIVELETQIGEPAMRKLQAEKTQLLERLKVAEETAGIEASATIQELRDRVQELTTQRTEQDATINAQRASLDRATDTQAALEQANETIATQQAEIERLRDANKTLGEKSGDAKASKNK